MLDLCFIKAIIIIPDYTPYYYYAVKIKVIWLVSCFVFLQVTSCHLAPNKVTMELHVEIYTTFKAHGHLPITPCMCMCCSIIYTLPLGGSLGSSLELYSWWNDILSWHFTTKLGTAHNNNIIVLSSKHFGFYIRWIYCWHIITVHAKCVLDCNPWHVMLMDGKEFTTSWLKFMFSHSQVT